MLETAFVFDRSGNVIHWHTPLGRSAGYLPDSHELWQFLWEHRLELGGVAHTHPWSGEAWASGTDVTTFAAIEAGLGRRLVWPIITFTAIVYLSWEGPGRLDYNEVKARRFRLNREDIEALRDMSKGGRQCQTDTQIQQRSSTSLMEE